MIDRDTERRMEKTEDCLRTTFKLITLDRVYSPGNPSSTYFEVVRKALSEDCSEEDQAILAEVLVCNDHEATHFNVVEEIHKILKDCGVC